jgi:hypothetical protein
LLISALEETELLLAPCEIGGMGRQLALGGFTEVTNLDCRSNMVLQLDDVAMRFGELAEEIMGLDLADLGLGMVHAISGICRAWRQEGVVGGRSGHLLGHACSACGKQGRVLLELELLLLLELIEEGLGLGDTWAEATERL